MTDDPSAEKAALRRVMRKRRAAAFEALAGGGDRLAEVFFAQVALPAGAVVSAFWPMGEEIDTRPLIERLHAAGHRVCLPVMQGAGKPLIFRAWEPGQVLQPGGFGTSEPGPDAALCEPDVLLVPLLAFDRLGYRLGYGGGFYDRTLAALRPQRSVLAFGLAFAAQEVDKVPREATDEPLDKVITERRVIVTR